MDCGDRSTSNLPSRGSAKEKVKRSKGKSKKEFRIADCGLRIYQRDKRSVQSLID